MIVFGKESDRLDCGHSRPHGLAAGEGYIMTPHGQMVCPACGPALSETVQGYLNVGRGEITTWAGVGLLKITKLVTHRTHFSVWAKHWTLDGIYFGLGTGDREAIRLTRRPMGGEDL